VGVRRQQGVGGHERRKSRSVVHVVPPVHHRQIPDTHDGSRRGPAVLHRRVLRVQHRQVAVPVRWRLHVSQRTGSAAVPRFVPGEKTGRPRHAACSHLQPVPALGTVRATLLHCILLFFFVDVQTKRAWCLCVCVCVTHQNNHNDNRV